MDQGGVDGSDQRGVDRDGGGTYMDGEAAPRGLGMRSYVNGGGGADGSGLGSNGMGGNGMGGWGMGWGTSGAMMGGGLEGAPRGGLGMHSNGYGGGYGGNTGGGMGNTGGGDTGGGDTGGGALARLRAQVAAVEAEAAEVFEDALPEVCELRAVR